MTEFERDMFYNIPVNSAQQCATCKNHIPMTLTCKAFPERIPDEIMDGKWDHREHYQGDNGILYEPKDPNFIVAAPYAKNKID